MTRRLLAQQSNVIIFAPKVQLLFTYELLNSSTCFYIAFGWHFPLAWLSTKVQVSSAVWLSERQVFKQRGRQGKLNKSMLSYPTLKLTSSSPSILKAPRNMDVHNQTAIIYYQTSLQNILDCACILLSKSQQHILNVMSCICGCN